MVVLGALLASACALDAGDTSIDVVFDPCSAAVVAAEGTEPHELEAIDAGLALWNQAAGLALARADVPGAIPIAFVLTLPSLFGVYDDEVGTITINRRIDAHDARSIVVAHELGHAFGLDHTAREEGASLMNPGNTTVPPTNEDVLRLRGLWGACAASDASAPGD